MHARLGELKEEEKIHPDERDSAEGKNEQVEIEDEDDDEEGGQFMHSPSSGKGDPPHERNIFDISDEMG